MANKIQLGAKTFWIGLHFVDLIIIKYGVVTLVGGSKSRAPGMAGF